MKIKSTTALIEAFVAQRARVMKWIVPVIAAAACALPPAMAQSPAVITSFTSPVPANDDLFGDSVAAVGSDRVLISASGRNSTYTNDAAYLFTTSGVWLTTFTNPHPTDNIFYGESVAAVGADHVLIGTYQSGIQSGIERAYLFSTNGALDTTFTNPEGTGGSSFGRSVAALGSDRVLIGAPFDAVGAQQGLVHLFAAGGELLKTIINPTGIGNDRFGYSVAAVGNDRILIGAPGSLNSANPGKAYLFSTNGTLLTTFNSPTPAPNAGFGYSLAAVGGDRVLIGAPLDGTVSIKAGAAWLFDTNGGLLTTFNNPSPAFTSTGFESLDGDRFGGSVAAVGTDRVLIGAHANDAPNGTRFAGTVYLFHTNGALLSTLTHPAPAVGGSFGGALAAFGSDRVLIGAQSFGFGAATAGRAYLFSIPPLPSLTIQLTAPNAVTVSWPSPSTGLVLQQNTNGLGPADWSNVTASIQDNGTNKSLIVNPALGSRFYRLAKP
jgi:FG-GAP repeat